MSALRRIALAVVALLAGGAACARGSDLPDLEELGAVPVYGASRHYLRQVDSPASVTVITSDDIRNFGYRTLGDLLRSVRGIHIRSDRNYDLLSLRGYTRSGDYNAGVSLQIDGMRINDPIYDGGLLGTEFPLDIDLIDRVEYIRGPGSAEFGGSALFGVINIVTKSGAAIGGTSVTLDAGSEHRFGSAVRLGRRFANGANLLLSASGTSIRGETLNFAPDEASGFPGGNAPAADFDRAKRAFAKFDFEDLSLVAAFGSRRKGDAPPYIAPYEFGSTESWGRDSEGFVQARYSRQLSETSLVSLRAYYGYYDYLGHWPLLTDGGRQMEHSVSRTDWSGAELRYEAELGPRLHLVSGIEHKRALRLDQADYSEPPIEYAYVADGRAKRTSGYVQLDYDLVPRFTLTAGLRADHNSYSGLAINPRVGLIFKPDADTAWKLLYGGGTRDPSAYERLWAMNADHLDQERVRNLELTLEQFLGPRTRAVFSLFAYRVQRVVRLVEEPESGSTFYANTGDTFGRGVEGELDHVAESGLHLRASASYSAVRTQSVDPVTNSPRWLLKGNVAQPLPWYGLRVGVEGQWTGPQYSYLGRVPSIGLANLTLLKPMSGNGWEASASLYNLFDRRYADPLPGDNGALTGGVIPQGGRQFRVTLTHRF